VPEPEFVQVTRAFYDNVAASYATRFGGELAARPLDRALLSGFAELVRAAGPDPIQLKGSAETLGLAKQHARGANMSNTALSGTLTIILFAVMAASAVSQIPG